MMRIVLTGLYLILLTMIATIHLLHKLETDTGGIISRYAPLLLVTVITFGICGYIFHKAIFKPPFWEALLGLLSMLSMTCIGTLVYFTWANISLLSATGVWASVILFLLFPAKIILYLYLYRSPAIWRVHS